MLLRSGDTGLRFLPPLDTLTERQVDLQARAATFGTVRRIAWVAWCATSQVPQQRARKAEEERFKGTTEPP